MHKAKKPILITAGLIAALLLFSVATLPVIVRSQAVMAAVVALHTGETVLQTATIKIAKDSQPDLRSQIPQEVDHISSSFFR